MSTLPKICFPVEPLISPLRLASDYRDYFGDYHAKVTELLDPILKAGCYVPRIYHAPSDDLESVGLAPDGFLEYALALPAGSFVLGFLHNYTSATTGNGTDAPAGSSFRFQLTDVSRQYRFFGKPLPEAWLLNDQPGNNPNAAITGGPGGGLYVLNPSLRLLPAPYPVGPPGMFQVEFWNMLATQNNDVRLSVFCAVPAVKTK
jgi:hypothetical protein